MADLEAVFGLDENADIADELQDFDTRSEASDSSASTSISSSSSVGKKRVKTAAKSSKRLVEKGAKSLSKPSAADDTDKSDVEEERPKPSAVDSDSESDNSDSAANIKRNGSRKLPPATKSETPEKLVPATTGKQMGHKSYDYMTKLNYLFRDTRFFLIKSNNNDNVNISKSKGVWATLPQNDANLTQAFKESRNVLLIFSVNESGKFAGFARISAPSSRDIPQVEWLLPPTISAKALGGVIKLDWVCRKELSFNATLHLHNPWNEGKPVKIGRDGQEIEPKVAAELCRLFPEDDKIEMTPILRKSKETAKIMREKGIHVVYKPPRSLSSRIRTPNGRGDGGGRSRGRGGNNFGPIRNKRSYRRGGDSPERSRPYKSHGRPMADNGRFRRGSPPPHYRRGSGDGHVDGHFSSWGRYMSSAIAESYVEYMRGINNQLPPLPFMPPFGQFPMPPSLSGANGALPSSAASKAIYDQLPPQMRYYEGPGAPPLPDYPPAQPPRPPPDFSSWKSNGTHLPPPPPPPTMNSSGSSGKAGISLSSTPAMYRNSRESLDANRARDRPRDYGRSGSSQLQRRGSDRDRHSLRNYGNRR